MALLIWLPLSKANSLSSLGLLSKNFLIGGSPVYNLSGKIGGCYSFNGTTDALYAVGDKSWWSGKEISFSVWFKCNETSSAGTIIELFADLTMNYRYDSSGVKFGYYRCYKNASNSRTGDTLVDPNYYESSKWHHIVATFEHQYNRIYVDGVLSHEFDSSSKYTTNWVPLLSTNSYKNIAICRSYGSTSFSGGLINDVRIYDHCLSPKEIEEISKGLVLHYKLDDPYIEDTVNLLLYSNLQGHGSSWTLQDETFEGTPIYKNVVTSPNTGNNAGFSIRSAFTPNNLSTQTKVTISFYKRLNEVYGKNLGGYLRVVKEDSTSGTYAWSYNKVNWANDSSSIGKWEFITATVTIPTECTQISHCYVYTDRATGGDCDFSKIQLEFKDHATPYVNGTRTSIICDCSGYNNNSTGVGLKIFSSTPRYSCSIHFDGNLGHIPVTYNSLIPDNIFTMNLWFKKDSLGTKNYETLFGGPSGFELDTRANTALTLSLYGASTRGTLYSKFNFGEWYMVTMVRDGTNEIYYVNGEHSKTIAAKSMPTGSYFIGAWKTATSLNLFGEISDFRLYRTPLSASQVKDLYNTSAIIDNIGNISSYQFDESNLGEITKEGISEFNLIELDLKQAFIYQQINPNLLQGTFNGVPKKTRITSTTEFGGTFTPTELLEINTNYTISMLIRGTAPMNIYTLNTGGNVLFQFVNKDLMNSENYVFRSCTFKVTGNRTINSIYICTRYGVTKMGEWFEVLPYSIKLEKGTSATEWIPAITDDMYNNYKNTLSANQFIEI